MNSGAPLALGALGALVVGTELWARSGAQGSFAYADDPGQPEAPGPLPAGPLTPGPLTPGPLTSGQRLGLALLLTAGATGLTVWAGRRTLAQIAQTPFAQAVLSDPLAVLDPTATPASASPSAAPASSVSLPAGVSAKSGVVWSDAALQFIRRFRQNVPPEVTILVNSATRTPESQAAAMVTKYQYAEARGAGGGAADIRQTYGSKAESFLAVPVTVESWANVVRQLHDSGRGFRDGHLGGTAVDIHIKTLPPAWIPLLVAGARLAGGSPTVEANPPHLHIDGFSRTLS